MCTDVPYAVGVNSSFFSCYLSDVYERVLGTVLVLYLSIRSAVDLA